MKINEVKRLLPKMLRTGLVPFLQGAPGIGKTEVVKQVAEEGGFPMFYLSIGQMPADGFLMAVPDMEKKLLDFFIPAVPPEEVRRRPWVFFLDEADKADPEVQDILLALLREKRLGPLHLGEVRFVLAGNSPENASDSQPFTAPLQGRVVQIPVEPASPSEWLSWIGQKYDNIPSWFVAFISQVPEKLWWTPAPPEEFQPYPSPSTWEEVLKWITAENPEGKLTDETILIAKGLVGRTAAQELGAFLNLKQNMFSYQQFKEAFQKGKVPQLTSTQAWYLMGELLRNVKKMGKQEILFAWKTFVQNRQVAIFTRLIRILVQRKSKAVDRILDIDEIREKVHEIVSWYRS